MTAPRRAPNRSSVRACSYSMCPTHVSRATAYGPRPPMNRRRLTAPLIAATAAAAPGAAGLLSAAFETGTTASPLLTGSDAANKWYDRTEDAGSTDFPDRRSLALVRADQAARSIQSGQLRPQPDRRRGRRATARGFEVLFTVYKAPTGPRPAGRAGVARGQAPGSPTRLRTARSPGPLRPATTALTAFRESSTSRPGTRPNLGTFLTPQWDNGKIVSDDHYRKMLNGVLRRGQGRPRRQPGPRRRDGALRRRRRKSGQGRTRPLQFYRELMCLKAEQEQEGRRWLHEGRSSTSSPTTRSTARARRGRAQSTTTT